MTGHNEKTGGYDIEEYHMLPVGCDRELPFLCERDFGQCVLRLPDYLLGTHVVGCIITLCLYLEVINSLAIKFFFFILLNIPPLNFL